MAKKENNNKIELEMPLPPDGGWGWMVMMASFLSNLLVDGILYTFGVLFIQLSNAFPEASKAQVSSVGSLLGGFYLIVGPFVGGLVNKFGSRWVAAVGAVFSCIAFCLSTLSTSINMMLLFYGCLGGIGFGLLYLPSIVMVGLYFDRKRAFATGIAVCGSGIGTLVFAPLAQILIDEYGWKGMIIIMGALMLNGFVCAIVYKPIKAKKKVTYDENNKESDKQPFVIDSSHSLKPSDIQLNAGDHNEHSEIKETDLPNIHPLYRADALYAGSITHLPEYTSNPDMRSYINSVTDIPKAVMDDNEPTRFSYFLDIFSKMFDFTLFASPTFLLICFSGCCAFMSFYAPFVYTMDYAIESTGSTNANYILSLIGLSNTVSRVIAGLIADRPWADSVMIHNFAVICAGFFTALMPFFTWHIAYFYIYATLFGFSIAAFIALRSIVICDLLGVHRLTNAFGIISLFQGISLLGGTPLLGMIYDKTGNYRNAYIVSGMIMMFGGLSCIPLRRINKWEKRREARKSGQPYDTVHT